MGWWTERVVPRMTEASLKSKEIGELRGLALAPAYGRVLELGFGTGLNLRWLPAAVTAVDAVEPSDVAWSLSAERRADSPLPIRRIGLDGARVEAEDRSYDTVVCTFTLCTIPDVEAALAEVGRLLRPEGVLCFLEHGLAPDPAVARWQHRLDPLERRLAGGCHLNRDMPALLTAANLHTSTLHTGYLPGTPRAARPWSWGIRGTARRATPRTAG